MVIVIGPIYRYRLQGNTFSAGINNTTTTAAVAATPDHIDFTLDDLRQHRILLLNAINNPIQSLPNNFFKSPELAGQIKNSLNKEILTNADSIASLLKSDRLDEAIKKLGDLRAKMDSSFKGIAADDLIVASNAQSAILPKIDNLIEALKKQM